eukprot:5958474-Pleurochrysis_carterae.AAC.1
MAQAGRRWQRTLFPWLLQFGFIQSSSDPCIFTLRKGDAQLIVGCYVDDLFVLHSDDSANSLYAEFTDALTGRWNVEDEGPVSDLLNVDIKRHGEHVTLSQASYIQHLVDTFMPSGVPDATRRAHAPAADDLPKLVDAALAAKTIQPPQPELLRSYQSLVGALLYCSTQTRPDVAYAVGMLCRAMSCPTPDLLHAAQRVLTY